MLIFMANITIVTKMNMRKELYVSPQSEALELRLEGVIALSPPKNPNPFGDQQDL